MKTMTCKQMGGPCDESIHGETAEEMMNNGAKHLQEANDEAHKPALAMMEDMQKNPAAGQAWNDDFAKKFAELPEN
jgi:predicted small metal-binding protein